MSNTKQVIVVRKDLEMSPGKLAAQVSHAATMWLANLTKNGTKRSTSLTYDCHFQITYNQFQWLNGDYMKVILGVKDKAELLKVVEKAKKENFVEGEDFFLIKDKCYTELNPEEEDGTVITCLGFAPMDGAVIGAVAKRLRLF